MTNDKLDEGTVLYGGRVPSFAVGLRVFGEDLDPQQVSRALGAEASLSRKKGERFGRRAVAVARAGVWILDSSAPSTADLSVHVEQIFNRLSMSWEVWEGLAQQFELALCVKVDRSESGQGFNVSSHVLRELAKRGVSLDFTIYDID